MVLLGEAARVCDDYINTETGTGVYDDWYLPSKAELNKLYINKVAIGGFADYNYWSSSETENIPNYAWSQDFLSGVQWKYDKGDNYARVRPVRSF